MHVWTVSNQKGGVGKTTTSVSLAGLACEKNMKVLLLDVDPHGSLTSYFKHNPDFLSKGIFTLFKERKSLSVSLIESVRLPTGLDNLDLLPASTALATLERQAIGDGMGLVLSHALSLVKDQYDLAIIDCPPQLGVLMVNALAACSQLVIPVQTEHLAIQGLDRMLHTVGMLAKSRQHPLKYTVVPTMFDRRTQASISSLRLLRNGYAEHAWQQMIPIDTKLRDASKAGIVPHIYAPSSRAVLAYRALYETLIDEEHIDAREKFGAQR